MGRFRFRVWNKEFKMMFYPLTSISMDILEGETSHPLCGNRKPTGSLSELEMINYPLMLSTNLFDKKSKEIYEGDIVKCDYGMKLGGVDCDYGTVEFNGLTFTLINRYILFEDEVLGGNSLMRVGCPEEYFYLTEERWEVIGNIFENPELYDIIKPKEIT